MITKEAKEKLIKNGKFYNPDSSTLVAVSTWFVNYKIQRRKVYKSKTGIFFEVAEVADSGFETVGYPYPFIRLTNGTQTSMGSIIGMGEIGTERDDVKLKEINIINELSEEEARRFFENIMQNSKVSITYHAKTVYKLLKTYDELFSIEEV